MLIHPVRSSTLRRAGARAFSSERHLLVDTSHGNGVVVLSLNRERQRNALSQLLIDQFRDAMAKHKSTASCVVLRSVAPGIFCAGADLKERRTMSQEQATAFVRRLRETFTLLEQLECPTISVVDGPALGGGCELALCTDLRVAASTATFGLPETGLAIIPGAGGTQRLPRLIGVSKAKELIFTGEHLSADQARDIGLVNHVETDFEQATAKALEMAATIGQKGPVAIRAAKKAVHFGSDCLSLCEGLELEDECYKIVLGTEDRLEGLAAFAEKRTPVYKGR